MRSRIVKQSTAFCFPHAAGLGLKQDSSLWNFQTCYRSAQNSDGARPTRLPRGPTKKLVSFFPILLDGNEAPKTTKANNGNYLERKICAVKLHSIHIDRNGFYDHWIDSPHVGPRRPRHTREVGSVDVSSPQNAREDCRG